MRSILAAIGDSHTYGVSAYITFQQQWLYVALDRTDTITQGSYVLPSSSTTINNKLVGTTCHVYNVGVDGNTTAQMLTRFVGDALIWMPGALFIMGGINDVLNDLTGTEVNLQTMMETATTYGVRVYWGTILPCNAASQAQRDRIDEINDWGRAYCAVQGHTVVDMYAALESPVGSQTSPYLLADNLHPTVEGNALMGAALADAFFTDGDGTAVYGVAPNSPVVDLVVQADGRMRDFVTGVYATSTGTPTVTARTPNKGYNANFGTGSYVTFGTSRMNGLASTLAVVRGDPASASTRYQVSWQTSTGAYTNLLTGGGSYGNPAANYYNGSTSYAIFGPTKAAAGECVHASKWSNGAPLYCYLNGTPGSGTANVTAAALPAQKAYVGRKNDGSGSHEGTIHRVVVYDTQLEDAQIDALDALLTGPVSLHDGAGVAASTLTSAASGLPYRLVAGVVACGTLVASGAATIARALAVVTTTLTATAAAILPSRRVSDGRGTMGGQASSNGRGAMARTDTGTGKWE